MKNKFLVSLLFISVVGLAAHASPEPPLEGKTIFMSRCAACHNVNKPLTGPALAGVDERRSIDWIINFVHSSQEMVKAGDKDAVALFEQFNRIPMPDHKDLTPENIKSIVEFIKAETVATTDSEAPFAKPPKKLAKYALIAPGDYWLFGGLILAVIMLIGAMVFAAKVKAMKNLALEKKQQGQ